MATTVASSTKRNQMRVTPEHITSLKPNEIFVFGSNLAGRHGAGAALLARNKFGAIDGIGVGAMGQSYGIPTKDRLIQTLPLWRIAIYVARFLGYAASCPTQTFLVTRIGCGLAGYSPKEIAPMFLDNDPPPNVILPADFI